MNALKQNKKVSVPADALANVLIDRGPGADYEICHSKSVIANGTSGINRVRQESVTDFGCQISSSCAAYRCSCKGPD